MSHEAVTWVLDNSTVTGQPKVLLIAMADRCHGPGATVCWPGLPELMRRTGTQKRQCINLINTLIAAGEILKEDTREHRKRKYRLIRYENSLAEVQPDCTLPDKKPAAEVQPDCTLEPSQGAGLASSKVQVSDLQGAGLASSKVQVSSPHYRTYKEQKNGEEQEPPPVELPKGFPDTEKKAIQWAMGAMPEDQLLDLWRKCHSVGGCIPWRKNLPPIRNWRSFVAAEASNHRTIPLPASQFQKNAGASKSAGPVDFNSITAAYAQ